MFEYNTEKKYISDIVGTDYETWEEGDTVLINAQTGSGKTSFILDVLLNYAKKKGEKILYLVNRKILKEQLNEYMRKKQGLGLATYIKIEMYQSLEQAYKNFKEYHIKYFSSNYNQGYCYNGLTSFYGYKYIIADECHYFSMDSMFNHNTELSFQWISSCKNSIVIYMSATMDFVKERIISEAKANYLYKTYFYGIKLGKNNRLFTYNSSWQQSRLSPSRQNNISRYNILNDPHEINDETKDYSYVKPDIISDKDSLVEAILYSKEKWLVFIDSKDYCKEIERELNENKVKCVFIDSDWDKREGSKSEVSKIRDTDEYESRVIVTTSVMDNGITIKDKELRNIVISTDTIDSLLQMLGRKREDGHKVNLYLMPMSVKTIREREKYYKEILDLVYTYEEELQALIDRMEEVAKIEITQEVEPTLIVSPGVILPNNMGTQMNGSNPTVSSSAPVYTSDGMTSAEPVYKAIIQNCINEEYGFVFEQSKNVIENTWGWQWGYIKSIFYSVGPFFLMNRFALDRTKKLHNLYKELAEENWYKGASELDTFLIERQLKLFTNDNEVKSIFSDWKKDRIDVAKRILNEEFEKIIGNELKKEDFGKDSEIFPQVIWDNIKILAQNSSNVDNVKKYKDMAEKRSPLSKPCVEWLHNEYNLPFKQNVNNGVYCLEVLNEEGKR